jgi:hypothetical protein
MITIVGRFEDGWLSPDIEFFIWKQLGYAYKVDRIVMVPKLLERRTSLDQYDTIEDAINSCDGEIVFMEQLGNVSLSSFVHPKNAVYVFGNASTNHMNLEGHKVKIDTPSPVDMFAVNAAAIVLDNRYNS